MAARKNKSNGETENNKEVAAANMPAGEAKVLLSAIEETENKIGELQKLREEQLVELHNGIGNKMFRHGGKVVRLRRNKNGAPTISQVKLETL